MSEDISTDNQAPKLSLWIDHRRREFRWEVDNGPVIFSYPSVMTEEELSDLGDAIGLALKSIHRTARSIAGKRP